VEELEDDIISLFSREAEHEHQELCSRVSGTQAPPTQAVECVHNSDERVLFPYDP